MLEASYSKYKQVRYVSAFPENFHTCVYLTISVYVRHQSVFPLYTVPGWQAEPRANSADTAVGRRHVRVGSCRYRLDTASFTSVMLVNSSRPGVLLNNIRFCSISDPLRNGPTALQYLRSKSVIRRY
jgi:hypothetical protein